MMGAGLIVVHVYPVPSSDQGEGMLYAGVESEDPDDIEQRLNAIQPCVEGVDVKHRLLKGDPAAEVLSLAKAEDVELIIMGTHGRTWLARLLMGSVAEDVARRAPCPVMFIKMPAEASD